MLYWRQRDIFMLGPENQSKNTNPEAFFGREKNLIADRSKGLSVTFEPGNGWSINSKTGKATYDLSFFTDQGFTYGQSVFAAAHELEHLKDTAKLRSTTTGQDLYGRWEAKRSSSRRTNILANYINDLAANSRIFNDLPALKGDIRTLYQAKLFPEKDLRVDQKTGAKVPRHIQFLNAILRGPMVPSEQVLIDEEVESAIAGLKSLEIKGRNRNILAIASSPTIGYGERIKLIEKYIEPVLESLFEKDKEDNQDQNQGQGTKGSDQGKGDADSSGTKSSGEQPFEQYYQEIEDKMPEPLTKDQAEEVTEEKGGQGSDVSDRQKTGYEKEHGVSMKDLADYRVEYQKIQSEISKVKAQFARIITERLIPKRRLVGFRDEGVIIASGLAAQAQADFARGVADPMVFMDFEGRVNKQLVPKVFEATGVFDRSGSMSGARAEEQRRAAILLMESLKDFMDQPEVKDGRLEPGLAALSEIRSFGSKDQNVLIKPLSTELNEKQRVETFKVLGTTPGWATEDYIVLNQVIDEIKQRGIADSSYLQKIKNREILKLVMVFSDGASSNESEYNKAKETLEQMGIKVVSYRRIKDGSNFASLMAGILEEVLNEMCYPKDNP